MVRLSTDLEFPIKKSIFAATNPTTPLNDAYHGGTSLFIKYMDYDKQPINVDEQVALLQNRGLVIEDIATAKSASPCLDYSNPKAYQTVPSVMHLIIF